MWVSDASDALGNFFSPKKKNLFFLLMSSNLVKTVTNVTFVDLTRPF